MTGLPPPDKEIQNLIDLVSNATEAHTSALFLAPAEGEPLVLYAYQSLSQNINPQVRIKPGEGLIGWVHKNNQAVNVDKFDHDTRRLIFYKADEYIKSFMAVPLPKVRGVLCVDNKQRYVFSDKSQKLLHQFGQALEIALEKKTQQVQALRATGLFYFTRELDKLLGEGSGDLKAMEQALSLIRVFTNSGACFLAAAMPPDHYYILAHNAEKELSLEKGTIPLTSGGLAGWILQRKQPLVLEKPRTDMERSFIFYPEEPLKHLPYFAGFPALWNGRLQGALLLARAQPFRLDDIVTQGLEMAALRLAACLEMEILFQRVAELGRLDPQAGLLNRTHFTKRLNRWLKAPSARDTGLTLMLFKIINLDEVALKAGQEAAQEVIRAAARYFLANTLEENELGHLSYGIIGLAAAGKTEAAVQKVCQDLAAELADWPLAEGQDRIKVETTTAAVRYPSEAESAEGLVLKAFSKLNQN